MALKSQADEQEATDNRYYRATGFTALKAFFGNFAHFRGRSSRSEYWWIQLFGVLAGVVAFFAIFAALLGTMATAASYTQKDMLAALGHAGPAFILGGLLLIVILLILVLPALALVIRRYRDAGLPWWVYLIQVLVFWVLLIIYPAQTKIGGYVEWGFNISVMLLCLLPSKPLPHNSDNGLDDRIQPDAMFESKHDDNDKPYTES